MPPETLTIGEFTRSMDRLHNRFNNIDKRMDDFVVDIATVKTLVEERTTNDKKSTRNSASGWSAAVAGLLIGAVELVKLWAR